MNTEGRNDRVPVTGREELKKLLLESKEDLKRFGAKRIGFFGSFVRDEATDKSDVDIVVELEKGRPLLKTSQGWLIIWRICWIGRLTC